MPTRKPGYSDGNRLVTRFGRTDDMDNDEAYRLGDNNKNKNRYAAAATPAETVNLTNATVQEFSTAPSAGDKEAGYEVLNTGNVQSVVNEDNGAGPPTFNQLNPVTDWIDNKSYVGTYHARMTQDSGDALGAGSSPLNAWREIGVDTALWLLQSGNGAGFQSFVGTIEISDDGGSTTLDSATITLETNEV